MAGYTYKWEAIRDISDTLILNCNFYLDVFPASLIRTDENQRLLISGTELYKLMEEIADRFDMKVVPK